ncbi:MAG: UDP-N-acetylmuramoylalanyl-D-glutamyl-2,6-diaminopimelate--D-alanyl-D-alanine ligase [Rhodospirillales bacterium]|nr:UDP-N-acetylmuramoylalanyl-D-glutamyl-2,6-diaminopimelate--D-alanyl-D-alanine ligase [Rhodospirillales bacterium]
MTAPLWRAADIIAATGGQPVGDGGWTATGVSIDSRTIRPGEIFAAIAGETHDGHDYVAAALAAGAAGAIVSRRPTGLADHARLIVVPDVLDALRHLGRAARARAAARIVAITGSVGKTGTKEALGLALAGQGETHASASSFNNHIGVPLTLARLPAAAAFGVFEIGMNHAGEIAPLVAMVRPHVAIVTTIEPVHLEFFPEAGLDGVAAAKAEIFSAGGGTAVLNRDNRYFHFLADAAQRSGFSRVIGFGSHPKAEARLVELHVGATHSQVSAVIDGRSFVFRIGTPGRHWAINALAVLAAAGALGADIGMAAAALAQLSPPKGRGKRHRIERPGGAFELIDDSYNASPASMRAAFEVLATAAPGPSGRRIAVLGDMLELGPDSTALHAGLASALVVARIDLVFTCGRYMAHLHDALPPEMRGAHVENSAQLAPLVAAAIRPGDVVTVKGSLGSRMAGIVEALLASGDTHNGNHDDPRRGPRRAANG